MAQETKTVKAKEDKESKERFPELGEDHLIAAIQEAEKEVAAGHRVIKLKDFRGQPEIEIKIHVPSVEIDAECSRIYAEKYNELLFSDKKVPTREEMEEKMRERGAWTQEHEDKLEELEDRITSVMREGQEMHYQKRVNKKRLKELKDEIKRLRDDKTRMLAKKQSMLSQTIESLCDIYTLEYKIYRCVTDKNDNPLWNSWEEFKGEKQRGVLTQLLQAGMIFWSGLPQDILSLLPEDINLRGVSSEQLQERLTGE